MNPAYRTTLLNNMLLPFVMCEANSILGRNQFSNFPKPVRKYLFFGDFGGTGSINGASRFHMSQVISTLKPWLN